MDRATAITQARYDRVAPFYDAMEGFIERSVLRKLRPQLWSRISATNILEVGVGTGKNIPAAVATFVFCSVPVPVQGLRELGRVTKPDGDIWLLEHVRINQPPVIGRMMDLLNPFVVRMMGANINRQTVENVKLAGLQAREVLPVRGEFVKLIHARPA